MVSSRWSVLGCGVGLRSQHYPVITEEWPRMDWFEAISENYMGTGGRPLHILEKVRRHYPIALHGTSLSIGSVDPLSPEYLERLKKLVERIGPFIVSDHLCWSGVKGEVLHDLLPLPFTDEAIRHVVERVSRVQDFLGRRILLENVSTYVTYRHSTMPEWEFLTEVAKRAGAGILLDLNNVYVNATNHRFDPHEYVRNVPGELIGQIHLAGHTDMGNFLFDTHSTHVIDTVWELYRENLRLWGPLSTLIEWDESIPPFSVLMEEAEKARKIYREFQNRRIIIARSPKGATKQSRSPEAASALPGTLPRNDQPKLRDTQLWMRERIQPREGKSAVSVSTETLLNPQGGEPGEERLKVYANGYLARIRETLTEVYESVHHVLGSERFQGLSKAYADRYASRNYNLNFAGRHLAEFLRSNSARESFPFLPDLARLEWFIWEAFHAFDEPPLKPSQISIIPTEEWENIQIQFQPSVRLIASAWPILDIWLARKQPIEELEKINLTNRSQQILVSRKEDQVQCEFLDENQYRLLEGLLAGCTLGRVCEDLADTIGEETIPLSEWFSRWVQDGLIRRVGLDHSVASSSV